MDILLSLLEPLAPVAEIAGSTYSTVIRIISVVIGIAAYIALRIHLKLPKMNFLSHPFSWHLEGVAMERITLLVLLKDVLSCLLGIGYIALTVYTVLASFYFVADYPGIWAKIFFLGPVIVRILFELLWLIIYKSIFKLIFKIIVGVVRFFWNFVVSGANLVLNFLRWLNSACLSKIEKNNGQIAAGKPEGGVKNITAAPSAE